ncbi:nucleic acid-binding protein [Ascobolus immersus RN42]|uniref:Nucleic acid-binding protein n=1 Tax=Ascobolus immersus RN42 TaxID=1160509 RepID=A0A3N4IJV2_ASCIM|nr:nucleic acid-binding protein [Ascobolus immersus RN42]
MSTEIVKISVPADDAALKIALRTWPASSLNLEITEVPAGTKPVVTAGDQEYPGYDTALKFIGLRAFPQDKYNYTTIEDAVIHDWVAMTAAHKLKEDTNYVLRCLNEHLHNRTFILTDKPSIADVAVFARLKDIVRALSDEEMVGVEGTEDNHGGLRYVVRYMDFIQNTPELGLKLEDSEKIKFDLDLVKKAGAKVRGPFVYKELSAIERLDQAQKEHNEKKQKAVEEVVAAPKKNTKKQNKQGKKEASDSKDATSPESAAAEGAEGASKKKDVVVPEGDKHTNRKEAKKEKKEKKPKVQPAKPVEAPLSPVQLDLRVGKILHCIPHPEADGLYISTISAMDPADSPYITALPTPHAPADKIPEGTTVRTVCSGLRKFIPLEEMQGRRVVLVCNLKPAKLKGIASAAMVLAASPRPEDGEKDRVELVAPPPDAEIGEQLVFEGYEEGEILPQLPPKKKIMETLTPGLGTNEEKVVIFDGNKVEALEKKVVGKLVRKGKGVEGGICVVDSLANALVK